MDEVRFRKIFKQAVDDKYPDVSYCALPYEIVEYLVEQLGQGNINDPILADKVMWYRAYDILIYMDNEIDSGSKGNKIDDADSEVPF